MSDAINPQHYKQGSIECIEAMEQIFTPEEFRGYLKGNVFKYLWRERKKKGIEDLRKAKWYLDRLVDSFDSLLAEINAPILEGESEKPKPSRAQPPSGYRMLGDSKVEPRCTDDLYWSGSYEYWTPIGFQISYANAHNWAACRKIEAPPRRYREPTLEDLKNGPIECEYRDDDDEQWRSGLLVNVLEGHMPFLCVSKDRGLSGQWIQCQIEVQE